MPGRTGQRTRSGAAVPGTAPRITPGRIAGPMMAPSGVSVLVVVASIVALVDNGGWAIGHGSSLGG
jgi:hypothetical protein